MDTKNGGAMASGSTTASDNSDTQASANAVASPEAKRTAEPSKRGADQKLGTVPSVDSSSGKGGGPDSSSNDDCPPALAGNSSSSDDNDPRGVVEEADLDGSSGPAPLASDSDSSAPPRLVGDSTDDDNESDGPPLLVDESSSSDGGALPAGDDEFSDGGPPPLADDSSSTDDTDEPPPLADDSTTSDDDDDDGAAPARVRAPHRVGALGFAHAEAKDAREPLVGHRRLRMMNAPIVPRRIRVPLHRPAMELAGLHDDADILPFPNPLMARLIPLMAMGMNQGPRPAPSEAIESLQSPTAEVLKKKEYTCSVCWEEITEKALEDDSVRQLPCSHIFHMKCIKTWLELHNTCPNCRAPLPVADGAGAGAAAADPEPGGGGMMNVLQQLLENFLPEDAEEDEEDDDAGDDAALGDGERWPCPACTFINEPHAHFCEMCEHHHPGRPQRMRMPGGIRLAPWPVIDLGHAHVAPADADADADAADYGDAEEEEEDEDDDDDDLPPLEDDEEDEEEEEEMPSLISTQQHGSNAHTTYSGVSARPASEAEAADASAREHKRREKASQPPSNANSSTWCFCPMAGRGDIPEPVQWTRCSNSGCKTTWFHSDCVARSMQQGVGSAGLYTCPACRVVEARDFVTGGVSLTSPSQAPSQAHLSEGPPRPQPQVPAEDNYELYNLDLMPEEEQVDDEEEEEEDEEEADVMKQLD